MAPPPAVEAPRAFPPPRDRDIARAILRGAGIVLALGAPLGKTVVGLACFLVSLPFLHRTARASGETIVGRLALPAAALMLAAFLAAFAGVDWRTGLVFASGLTLMVIVGLAAGRALARDQEFLVRVLVPLLLLSTAAAAAHALYEYFVVGLPRTDGPFGSPNRLSRALVFFGFLGTGFLLDSTSRRRWLAIPYSILTFLALGTTLSRGAWLGAAAGLALLTLRGVRGLVLTLTGLVTFGIALAADPDWLGRLRTALSPQANWDRITLWETALRVFRDHPLIGVGLGNFPRVEPLYVPVDNPAGRSSPHNLVFSLAAETGLAGLAAFTWLLLPALQQARTLWRAGRPMHLGLIAALVALLVGELFDQGIYTMQIGSLFWIGLGMLGAFAEAAAPQGTPGER